MGGTGGTARVNGPCAVSWAEGLTHSTVWHGTVGTAQHVVVTCWHGTAACRAGTARWPPIAQRTQSRRSQVSTATPPLYNASLPSLSFPLRTLPPPPAPRHASSRHAQTETEPARSTPRPEQSSNPAARRSFPSLPFPNQPTHGASPNRVQRGGGGVGGAAPPISSEARRRDGALRVACRRRAPVVPLVPALGMHGPLGPVPIRALLAPLPRPHRRHPGRRALPPRLPRHPPTLLRRRPALSLRRLHRGFPLPLLLLPPHRPPPPPLPRQAPHQERPRPDPLHGAPRLLLPPPGFPRRPLLRRRGSLQGVVVRHLRRPRPVLRQRRPQRRPRLLPRDGVVDVPQRRVPPHLRAVQTHLPPPGPTARGLRGFPARGRRGGARRCGRRPQGAPRHPQAAQGHQPQVPQVHRRRAPHRHRQPVRGRATHHAPRLRRRPLQHRRARAMFSRAHVRAHHNPEQRGEDHPPGAGAHRPHHQVARLLHHRARRGRGRGARVQPELHDRAGPFERQRHGVRRLHRRRRGPAGEHQDPSAACARHLLPEEAGASDIPGEQQSRDHGVRVHAGPVLPAHHIHAGVDALPVAARQDDRLLLKGERKTTGGRRCRYTRRPVQVVVRSWNEAETSFGVQFFLVIDELCICLKWVRPLLWMFV